MKHYNLFSRMMALFLTMILLVGMIPGAAFAMEEVTEETMSVEATSGTVPAQEDGTDSPTETEGEPASTTTLPKHDTTESVTEPATEIPSVPLTEPTTKEVPSEPSAETTATEDSKQNILSAPIALDTSVEYFDDFFALLHASQEGMEYQFLTSCAEFSNPAIHAYTFEVDPDVESIGFEIQLEGVNYYNDPIVSPSGQLEIRIPNRFLDSDPETIQVFDISGDPWIPLTLDSFTVSDDAAVIRLWVPDINSRFAVIEGFSEVALYNEYYGETLGDSTYMGCNNKTAWCVSGKNPYGFGNSRTGTFALHLVHKPSSDPSGKTTGYSDYVAGGCLEYWKKEPTISEGQIVNANYGGYIGGWSDLSVQQRREIVSYMLYGVRYLSDGSFTNTGSATINSTNPVVNMTYAQQILIWCTVKGVDPWEAIYYWGQSVPYYAEKIMDLASRNPENYDYDKTLVMVGEGNSRQDLVVVLKPVKKEPPKGDLSVDKSVVGSSLKAGWVIDLYDSYSNAQYRTNQIKTATTNSSGRAKFTGLTPGKTYYIREAPASRQQNSTDSWTLDDQILSATVEAGVTTNAGSVTNVYQPNYPFTLHKVSKCNAAVSQQLKGNKMYSLAGAKYKVTLNGQQQEILTTDASGNAKSSRSYPVNTRLVIQEIESPPGYKLDSTQYPLFIQAGDNKIEVADEPVFDPTFAITKVDKDTTTPQGDSSFSGAIFKWEYFDNTDWSGTPKRTWYLKTGENGRAHFDQEHLAPGYRSDPFYVDASGAPDLPLGTITMTEIQNTLGYIVLPQPLKCSIVADSNSPAGAKHIFDEASMKFIRDISAGNVDILEPVNEELFGSFTLDKIDTITGSAPQGNTNLAAKFQIINRSSHSVKIGSQKIAQPGEVCCEFMTDEAGHFSSGKVFPLGTYEIKEIEPPQGYELNQDWVQNFTVTKEQHAFDFTAESGKACANKLILNGSFSMDKLDMDTGSAPQGDGTLENAVFELINNSKNPITMDGKAIAPGEVLLTFKTDADGHYEYTGLPIGSYYLQELTPPEGYEWDYVWMYDFDITPDHLHTAVEPEYTCQNYVIRGGLKIIKQDSILGSNTTKDAPLDGITFTVTNESKHPVMVDGKTYAPGEAVMTLAIAWDGTAWSAETGKVLPYGTYSITENETTPGMANDFYLVNTEKKLVEVHSAESVSEVLYLDQMAEGKIIIHKVDPLGKPLADAKFQLQWSADEGVTWYPVTYSETITKGGCSAPELKEGSLVSGEDGIITFSGLHPLLHYRVVELEAPEGYVLLTKAAFEGKLPTGEFVYTMTVHNSPGFTFPTTGANGLQTCLLAGFMLSIFAVTGAVFVLYSKKRKYSHN